MKYVTYNLIGGETKTIEYDENTPCICCGEPVIEASMGGTALCPACDMGICRYCGIKLCGSSDLIKIHVQSCKREVKSR